MDRRCRIAAAGAGLAFLLTACVTTPDEPIRALAWLDRSGAHSTLTTEPVTLLVANSPGTAEQIALGEALFHNPFLLGGQAAKAGISCASCHINGRDNPHFHFPGVSGEPGTADVTHSFFSSHRGDGTFNPVAIPDLAAPGKISRRQPGELEAFIRGLIVEEFDGEEPGGEALTALAHYVRALRGIEGSKRQAVSAQTHIKRAAQSLRLAQGRPKRGEDSALADLLLAGAQQQLGLIHQRMQGRRLAAMRDDLLATSRQISVLRQDMKQGEIETKDALGDVVQRLEELGPRLEQKNDQSLYHPERLREFIERL